MSDSVASVLLVTGSRGFRTVALAEHLASTQYELPARDATWLRNVPNLEEWLENLETAVREAEAPMVIVAHSLSCSLVAHWLCLGSSERVAAAMLVSLADADSDAHMPPEARVFSPVPPDPLPFRAMVIASSTDPYVDIGRARLFARCWGARLVEVGDQERINVDSGHGEWSAAKRYLAELLEEV